jgi:pimeloyl-ACP methyl ester carboxylesterase
MQRRDFEVHTRSGASLKASQWRPSFVDDTASLPCVVYLHGNSSARVDIVRTRSLSALGAVGCSVVAFDFSGSGLSDGEYVTLGEAL